MTTFNRWALVVLGVVVLVAAPVVVRALPVAGSEVGAGELLATVVAAEDRPYSGYVETAGTLQLPAADRFSSVGALFGETTRMRVWWRDAESWRVDRLLPSGEQDLVHEPGHTTAYDYEDARATVSHDPEIRLPRTADLLPPDLARRMLTDVTEADVSRIASRRVAGIAAPGLRVVPASPRSSIDHLDLWADEGTGLPLRIEVYSRGARGPDFTSTFLDVDLGTPSAERVEFRPSRTTDVDFDDVLDIADAANQYAPLRPPRTVAGLAQAESSDGAVGVYGAGATQLIAIPLRDREADPLREQIARTPGATRSEEEAAVHVGPLTVLLTGAEGDGGWLVAGTVTSETAAQAGRDLLRDTVYVGDR